MKSPHLLTPLPGPKAKALLDRDRPVASPSYPRDYPFVMDHGRGAQVWDVDGNRFLDFAAGIAVCSTGHCHPQVVAAALGAIARAHGMTRLAKETGLNREGLYRTLSGAGNPELETFLKVIKALGLQLKASAVSC